MKPILYPETETEFTNNGTGILTDAVSCRVKTVLNGSYELEMKYPVTGIHFGEITERGILFALAGPDAGKQPFRIYRISKPLSGTVTVYARHVAYDMMGIPVSRFTAESAEQALSAIKTNASVDCPFTFYTDVTTDATMETTAPMAMWSLLGGTEGSVLDTFGGEYEFDRWTVRLWQHRGEDRGVSIRYGKNLTDLNQDENCANCYTGVYPYWKNADGDYIELPEKNVAASGTYSYTKVLPLDLSTEFEEKPTETQLRARAELYIKENDIGTPTVSWKIEFVQLEQTEEYKTKAQLEQVMMGDTVAVEFAEMGISASARVVETCYDSIMERYESVTLGKVRANLADIVVNQQKKLAEKPGNKAVGLTIQTLTAAILGAKGGAVRFLDEDNDGQPDTLYVANEADPDTATKVWRFNYEGWGGSTSGYKGPFAIGATIGGGFVAGWITTGKLSSADGTSYFDLDNNLLVTGNITATGGTIGGCKIVNGVLQIAKANISEKLTADEIDATNLKVSAANITGTFTVKNTSGTTLLSAGGNAVTIGGWKTSGSALYSGSSFAAAECFLCTGSTSVARSIAGSPELSSWMLKAGSNFGVTTAGALYAADAYIRGKIEAEEGSIGDWNVGDVEVISAITTVYSGPAIYSDKYYDAAYKTSVQVALTPDTVYIWGLDSTGAAFVDSTTWGAIIVAANK